MHSPQPVEKPYRTDHRHRIDWATAYIGSLLIHRKDGSYKEHGLILRQADDRIRHIRGKQYADYSSLTELYNTIA